MDWALTAAAVLGDTSVFSEANRAKHKEEYFLSKTITQTNILHLAAETGQLKFIEEALKHFPCSLLHQKDMHGQTPLHMAVSKARTEIVRLLINSTTTASTAAFSLLLLAKDNQGYTPFHTALHKGHFEIADELFSAIDGLPDCFSSLTTSAETPLHVLVRYLFASSKSQEAISDGNGSYEHAVRLLRKLLSRYKLAACMPDNDGLTPLLRAASSDKINNLLILKIVVGECPESVEVCDPYGRTVLHLVSSYHYYTAIKDLVEIPHVNPLKNSQDCDGNTPAHLALQDGDFAKVRVLSETSADFNIRNKEDISAADLMAHLFHYDHNKDVKRRKTMVSEMDESLYKEAVLGKTDSLQERRLERGNGHWFSRTPQGSSILHLAILHDQSAFVEEALKTNPALIFTKDHHGDTALHIAARLDKDASRALARSCKDCVKMAELHLGRPIEVYPWELRNSRGNTPLHEALRVANNIDIALEVLNMGDRWSDVFNDDPESPLHILAKYGPTSYDKVEKIMKVIRANKWAVYRRDMDGLTPLIRAAQCGRTLVIYGFLASFPQSVEILDDNGRSFLHHLRLTKTLPPVADHNHDYASTSDNKDDNIAGGDNITRHADVWMWESLLRYPIVDSLRVLPDRQGNTPLHLAIKTHGDFEVAKLLLRQCLQSSRKELTIKDRDDNTVLDLLTTASSSSIPIHVKQLLRQAMAGSVMDEELYEAATKGDDDQNLFERLRSNNINDGDYFLNRTRDGSNIVHLAVRHGHYTPFIEQAFKNNFPLMYQKDSTGATPLHLAARLPSPPSSFKFLELFCDEWWLKFNHQPDANKPCLYPPPWRVKDWKGNTYLHEAARTSNYQLISSTPEHLMDEAFSHVNDNGETPLHLLARYATYTVNELLAVVEIMLSVSSTAAYIRDVDGLTPVLRATKCGRLRVAYWVLTLCPRSMDIRDYKGRTVLHHFQLSAVDLVDDSIDISQLCDLVYDISGIDGLRTAQDEDGNTPLHLAIKNANVAAVKYFVEKCLRSEEKQELNILNNDGFSVFDLLASQAHHPDMRELQKQLTLRKRHEKERALIGKTMEDELYKAAVNGDAKIFSGDGGGSPTEGDVESGRVLRHEDAYYLSQTIDGSNIIHIALQQLEKQEVVVEFVEQALNRFPSLIVQTDSNGDTPLHLAAKWLSPVSLKLLDRVGDDYQKVQGQRLLGIYAPPWIMKNSSGNAPIHEAFKTSNLPVGGALAGVHGLSLVNNSGETPLHVYARYACQNTEDPIDFPKQLITTYPCATYVRDSEGLTPLMRAAVCGNILVVRAILENSPQSAYLRDPNGRTFLHLLRFSSAIALENSADYIFKWMGKNLFRFPEADAQRRVQDNDGNTPLHCAIKTGNSIAVEIYIQRCLESEYQFELFVANYEGETIRELIASYEMPNEVIKKLFKTKAAGVKYAARSSYGIGKAEIKETAAALFVIAGLLATMTFGAAFQVPGGFNGDDDGSPILLRKAAFQVFLASDALAMSGSMVVLFSLLLAFGTHKRSDSFILIDLSITLLQASFYLTLVAFMTGVYATTAHHALWLAIFVCAICSFISFFSWRSSILSLVKFIKLLVDFVSMLDGFSTRKYKQWVEKATGSKLTLSHLCLPAFRNCRSKHPNAEHRPDIQSG